ncbi:MAG: hypothetical protein IPH44_28070 [Myxococcales bacterium]|nr:hypothetical protein [Myxococcales bacterium]
MITVDGHPAAWLPPDPEAIATWRADAATAAATARVGRDAWAAGEPR